MIEKLRTLMTHYKTPINLLEKQRILRRHILDFAQNLNISGEIY